MSTRPVIASFALAGRHLSKRLGLGVLLLLLLPTSLPAQDKISYAEALLTQAVRPDFVNPWYTSPPSNPALAPVATSFHSGVVCGAITVPAQAPRPCAPTDGNNYLVRASFGQAFARTVPTSTSPGCPPGVTCDFVGDAKLRAARLLYYTEAQDVAACTPPFPNANCDNGATFTYGRSAAAFRYKDLMYSNVGGTPVSRIEARLSNMGDFYGQPERDRSLAAERLLRDALKYAPNNHQLRNSLLDLYYDRAVAEQMFAKEKLVDVARARLDPPPVGGFVINNEIAAYEAALGDPAVPGGYRYALKGYFELLRDPVGVATGQVAPGAPAGTPFGYRVFQQEVPTRSLYGANYLVGNVPTPVLNNGGQPIVGGWKDLTMLFDVLVSYGDATTELARLYAMRSQGTDIADALELIDEAQEKLYLEGTLLLSAFNPASLPGAGDQSGLAEKIAGWRHQMRQLQMVREFIEGGANLLGYGDDFLMLVQQFQPGGALPPVFDSYDAIYWELTKPTTGPLSRAITKHDAAVGSYTSYVGNRDQLATQYADRTSRYDERLFAITGAIRNGPGYTTPETNVGSEIWLQLQSIEAARLRIEGNAVRLQNLIEQIEIEVDRRGQEAGIQNAISSVIIDYGSRQASLTKQIAVISAAQAYAQAAAAAIGGSSPQSIIAGSVNAPAQAAGELAKGRLQAKKEELAAEERARINDLNGTILDVNSKAQIKTWWLQAKTIDVENQEAVLLLFQEQGRLVGLYNERDEIEQRMDRENALLADRHFADPIHLLRMQTSMLEAFDAFQVAQHWVFYTVRALEYKWNRPFVHTPPGSSITWSTGSLFRLRNAEELEDMVAAMESYDNLQSTLPRDDYAELFSVREDFFGYRLRCTGVNPPYDLCNYNDPITNLPIPVDPANPPALVAFRRQLQSLRDADGNIILNFSTVREKAGTNFFRGPRYSASGTLISKGTFLDKIEYLTVALPGSHTTIGTELAGLIKYGGTSFIRNQAVGTVPDPNRPDRVVGEMTAYSTRYWYYDGDIDAWQFSDGLSLPVTMKKSANPNIPPSVAQVNGFRERSVAATGWQLLIPTEDLGKPVLSINELNDIEIYFYHYSFARP